MPATNAKFAAWKVEADLQDNSIERVTAAELLASFGPQLSDLNMANNLLTAFPLGLDFRGLRGLNLDGNQIKALAAGAFGGLPSLETITMRRNNIVTVSPFLMLGVEASRYGVFHRGYMEENPANCGIVNDNGGTVCMDAAQFYAQEGVRSYRQNNRGLFDDYIGSQKIYYLTNEARQVTQKFGSGKTPLDRTGLRLCMQELLRAVSPHSEGAMHVSLVCDVLDPSHARRLGLRTQFDHAGVSCFAACDDTGDPRDSWVQSQVTKHAPWTRAGDWSCFASRRKLPATLKDDSQHDVHACGGLACPARKSTFDSGLQNLFSSGAKGSKGVVVTGFIDGVRLTACGQGKTCSGQEGEWEVGRWRQTWIANHCCRTRHLVVIVRLFTRGTGVISKNGVLSRERFAAVVSRCTGGRARSGRGRRSRSTPSSTANTRSGSTRGG